MSAKQDDEYMKYIRWASEEADKAAGWVSHRGMPKAEVDAYREGIRQGYLKAIAAIRMHGGKL
jgi:hypothetical protein